MKNEFPEIVEQGRDKTDMRFGTALRQRFGLFRIKSPFTGATLRCIVGNADLHAKTLGEEGWDHVSVSKIDKVPSWEEMCYIKDLFFDEHEVCVQYHPAKSDYVNIHPHVLHLWACPTIKFPMPNKDCV